MKPELIETMLADPQGRIALWDLHMQRLEGSARVLGYVRPDPSALCSIARSAIDQAQTSDSNSRGSADADAGWRVRLLMSSTGSATVTVTPQPVLTSKPGVVLSAYALDSSQSWLRHKTTHRPWYDSAAAWLQRRPDYFDVLFCNERGELCEGSRSNVYLKIDGQWLTPPLSSGLLPGVWRRKLLDEGQVRQAILPVSYLTADATVRLSNGLRGWFDVRPDLTLKVS